MRDELVVFRVEAYLFIIYWVSQSDFLTYHEMRSGLNYTKYDLRQILYN